MLARRSVLGALGFVASLALTSAAFASLARNESAPMGPMENNASALQVLEGSVSTDSGEPLVGALVSIFGANLGGRGLIAFTDEDGHFLVPDLEPGLYMIRAYLSGFLPSSYSRIQVDVGEEVSSKPVSMQLASRESDADRTEGLEIPEIYEDENIPSEPTSETDQKVAEFQWLLRHGKRNILHQEAEGLPEYLDREQTNPEDPASTASPASEDPAVQEVAALRMPPKAMNSMAGELGLFAFQRGLDDLPTTPGEVDAQLTYARLNIPTGPASQWMVSAQLLESALSSWMAQAEFITELDSGQQLSAGVAYGSHQYRDIQSAPVASVAPGGITYGPSSPSGSRTSEWFGTVYGSHRFRIGAADVGAVLAYHHYSYLHRSNYAAPRVDVSFAVDSNADTLIRGLLDYRVSAPGGEGLDLLSRMVSADFLGTAERGLRGPANLTAETAIRYQVSVERRLGSEGAVEVRVFQEQVKDPLLKAYLKHPAGTGGPGHYLVLNQGDMQARGVGLAVSRQFGAVSGSFGYTFGLGRSLAENVGAFQAGNDEQMHDLTTSVQTQIRQTRTRVLAMYRLSTHPTLAPSLVRGSRGANARDSRFNLQVHQLLPFVGWNNTQWELMVAVRNLFYENFEDGTFLEEMSVIDSPARVLGGVTVQF